MKRNLLFVISIMMVAAISAQRTIVVKKGDAKSLLEAVEKANEQNATPQSSRTYILIPDGCYDLGETVLTRITGHNIAFIGQSMEGTIIQNKPDVRNEGISKTAVFQNRGTGTYFQDLTLRNGLDYYACGAAGRAVTLHDKGTRTICNRVRLLSYQDTYYSDNEQCQHYFKDSEIHGTVDFICGSGDVWFDQCRIVTEKRTADGSGRNVIAAPRTQGTKWGYVFHRCTVENMVSDFEYARGWHSTPRCVWLYTTLLTPEKLMKPRFDSQGMRTVVNFFKEYGTTDAAGRDITPASNIITYELITQEGLKGVDSEIRTTRTDESVMTAGEAARYTVGNAFGDWHPDGVTSKIEKKARKLMKHL